MVKFKLKLTVKQRFVCFYRDINQAIKHYKKEMFLNNFYYSRQINLTETIKHLHFLFKRPKVMLHGPLNLQKKHVPCTFTWALKRKLVEREIGLTHIMTF